MPDHKTDISFDDPATRLASLTRGISEELWEQVNELDPTLIQPPFTPELVALALQHLEEHGRPWIPHAHADHPIVYEAVGSDFGYILESPDRSWTGPEPRTWRQWAAEQEVEIEELAEGWNLEPEEWDDEVYEWTLWEHEGPLYLPHSVPYQYLFSFLLDNVGWVRRVRFPLGELRLIEGPHPGSDAVYVEILPEIALTFAQVYLDSIGAGVKLVLGDPHRGR